MVPEDLRGHVLHSLEALRTEREGRALCLPIELVDPTKELHHLGMRAPPLMNHAE